VAIPSINNLAASRLFFLDTVHPVVIIVVRLLVSIHALENVISCIPEFCACSCKMCVYAVVTLTTVICAILSLLLLWSMSIHTSYCKNNYFILTAHVTLYYGFIDWRVPL